MNFLNFKLRFDLIFRTHQHIMDLQRLKIYSQTVQEVDKLDKRKVNIFIRFNRFLNSLQKILIKKFNQIQDKVGIDLRGKYNFQNSRQTMFYLNKYYKSQLFQGFNDFKNNDQQKMVKFFDKKITKVQLLYRGTRDSFKVAKFHQKCDNISNTLTIVQTDRYKIFGGYTPLIWTSQQNYYQIKDNELQSFIFQSNQNHKFQLKKSEHAIRRDILYGPTFANGQDIIIKDDANINDNSSANIGTSYQNDSYVKGDANSWEKLSGRLKFRIKQYQVWQITFV